MADVTVLTFHFELDFIEITVLHLLFKRKKLTLYVFPCYLLYVTGVFVFLFKTHFITLVILQNIKINNNTTVKYCILCVNIVHYFKSLIYFNKFQDSLVNYIFSSQNMCG